MDLVISTKELKEIYVNSSIESLPFPTRYVERFFGNISVYLTWVALKLNLSANFVTCLSAVCAIAGASLLMFNTVPAFLAGGILLQLYYILDFCDGQIARYMNTCSLGGLYLDNLIHTYAGPMAKFMLAMGIYRELGSPYVILLGFIAAYISTPDFIRYASVIEYLRTRTVNSQEERNILMGYNAFQPFQGNNMKQKLLVSLKSFLSQPNVFIIINISYIFDIAVSHGAFGNGMTGIAFTGARLFVLVTLGLCNVLRHMYFAVKHTKELSRFR